VARCIRFSGATWFAMLRFCLVECYVENLVGEKGLAGYRSDAAGNGGEGLENRRGRKGAVDIVGERVLQRV